MGCKASKAIGETGICDKPADESVTPAGVADPVRQRRTGISAQAFTQKEMNDWKKPVHEKSDEAIALLKRIISTNMKLQVLFGHLSPEQIHDVIMAMFPRDVVAGEQVIKQGDNGDAFWIVESGTFDIFVNRKKTEALGDKVASCVSGACFGELALMYNAPRAATVSATSAGCIWGLDAVSFKMMLVTSENTRKKKYEAFLEQVSILAELNAFERASLSDVIDVVKFTPGEVIMKQGEQGNNFYILESGEAKAFIASGSEPEVLAKHYSQPGEYFGELALILASARKATVYAGEQGCTLLFVSKEKFDRILGPIKHRLKVDKYPQYADIIEKARAAPDEVFEDEDLSPKSG